MQNVQILRKSITCK